MGDRIRRSEPCTYLIQIGGELSENELNAASPFQMAVVRVAGGTTLAAVQTDQSGLMGLLGHLHGLGYVLMSMQHPAIDPDSMPAAGRGSK